VPANDDAVAARRYRACVADTAGERIDSQEPVVGRLSLDVTTDENAVCASDNGSGIADAAGEIRHGKTAGDSCYVDIAANKKCHHCLRRSCRHS
jgi:hypothetical protein